jgi:hypothetical protein
VQFDIYSNKLGGTVPTEIGKLTKLEILLIGENGLNGALPTEIGMLTNLQYTVRDKIVSMFYILSLFVP